MANTRGSTTSGDAAVGSHAGHGAAGGSPPKSSPRSRRAQVAVGTPQERLEILKQAAIEAAKVGLRIDVIPLPERQTLVLAIRGAYQCPQGHWFLANETLCPACHTELPENGHCQNGKELPEKHNP